MGSVMAVRSKETVRCVLELSNDEQLREVPLQEAGIQLMPRLPRGRKVCISPAFSGALTNPDLCMFEEQWLFLPRPAWIALV